MATESRMNHAGRTSTHPFSDLRSARHARNRTLAHRKKYTNFTHLSPADLPSHPAQQSHYLPICSTCASDTSCQHFWTYFPADLSSAPIHKFTKRQAYEEAAWGLPYPTRSNSRVKKELPKWERRRQGKREMEREMREVDWREEVRDQDKFSDHMVCCAMEGDSWDWGSECWVEEVGAYGGYPLEERVDEGYASMESEADVDSDLERRGGEFEEHAYGDGDSGVEIDIAPRNPVAFKLWAKERLDERSRVESLVEADWDIISIASSIWTEVDDFSDSDTYEG
ncbi:hypothetical protein CC78DRAFT_576772 [Lojkania enalia]|uniref:Uncharacterized protein n=1 Tax=Lojkania enalia TaxID=147567 RepID=A0A9P4KHE6_9PLEO|nr:hypothetical protein CC78DRAFT_576772 [Didymosphaeria enalia]